MPPADADTVGPGSGVTLGVLAACDEPPPEPPPPPLDEPDDPLPEAPPEDEWCFVDVVLELCLVVFEVCLLFGCFFDAWLVWLEVVDVVDVVEAGAAPAVVLVDFL